MNSVDNGDNTDPDQDGGENYQRFVTLDPKFDRVNHEFDLLIIADNSYSMTPAHENLAKGLEQMGEQLKGRNVRVKIFSTSDAHSGNSASDDANQLNQRKLTSYLNPSAWSHKKNLADSLQPGKADNLERPFFEYATQTRSLSDGYTLGEVSFKESMNDIEFGESLARLVESVRSLGDQGNDQERGLSTLARILAEKDQSQDILRKNAKAAIIFISDEDDKTPLPRSDRDCNRAENISQRWEHHRSKTLRRGAAEYWNHSAKIQPKINRLRVLFEGKEETTRTPIYRDGVIVGYNETTYRTPVHNTNFYWVNNPSSLENGLNCNNVWYTVGTDIHDEIYSKYMPAAKKSDFPLALVDRVRVQCQQPEHTAATCSVKDNTAPTSAQCSSGKPATGSELETACKGKASNYYPSMEWEYSSVDGCKTNHVPSSPDYYVDVNITSCLVSKVLTFYDKLNPDATSVEEAIVEKLKKDYAEGDLHISSIVHRVDPHSGGGGAESSCASSSSEKSARLINFVESHLQGNPNKGSVHPICSNDYTPVLGDQENGIANWIEETIQTEFKVSDLNSDNSEKIESVSIIRNSEKIVLDIGVDYIVKGDSFQLKSRDILQQNDKIEVGLSGKE